MKQAIYLGISVLLLATTCHAFSDALNITAYEYVTEAVAGNGTGERMWDEYNNRSWSNLSLWMLNVTGKLNITDISSESISSLNVTLGNTGNLVAVPTLNSSPSYSTVSIGGSVGNVMWVYINELHSGDSVVLDYDVDDSAVVEPLNITENYSKADVLIGGVVNITINITNQLSSDITGIRFTKTAYGYENTTGGTNYFEFNGIYGEDATNASIDLSTPNVLEWNCSKGNLSAGSSTSITLDVKIPNDLNISQEGRGVWLNIGNVSVNFTAMSTISGLTIENVTGISDSTLSAGKERINETHWRAWPQFNDTSNSLDYNLTTFTVWATQYQDYNPGNTSIANSRLSWTPEQRIPNGTGWTNTTGSVFAYESVPVVWGEANFTIWDNDTTGTTGQIDRYTRAYQGSDGYLYIEDIFVLVGYMVKVTKHVVPSGMDNQFNVSIVLENIGNSSTPALVIVYDLIPPRFNLSNTTNGIIGDEGEINVTPTTLLLGITSEAKLSLGSFSGYQPYYVSLGSLSPNSNGDGSYDAAPANSEVLIDYQMNGTGLYHVENAFIVGVDPIRVEGAHASTIISSMFGVMEAVSTPESLIFAICCTVVLLLLAGSFRKGR